MTGAREEAVPLVRVPRVVGRDAELERLRRALADPSALVLVEGEAGIGKTRLVQEVINGRERLLVAVCPPFQDAATLGPVVDAVRQTGVAPAGLGLSGLAGALRPLFPETRTGPTRPPSNRRPASPGAGAAVRAGAPYAVVGCAAADSTQEHQA
ncbi:ATP-binding protein [Nonomuraea sp. PA05]|uniref:ATP-binding protein n=1 Tax=Nonomuraea sp. PA05 TaxID=2604466 RepID=UPI0021CC9699|nr:AAA family ATPase [Nonomuraea sp. PA05]